MKEFKKDENFLFVVEGVESVWHYHLSKTGLNGFPALCGKKSVMHTELKLRTWGMKSHLNETYCSECKEKAERIFNINLKEFI